MNVRRQTPKCVSAFWVRGQQTRANGRILKAIANGTMVRPEACEQCGGGGRAVNGRSLVIAHHPDYNHALQVMWLCRGCHGVWHAQNVAVMALDLAGLTKEIATLEATLDELRAARDTEIERRKGLRHPLTPQEIL